MTLSNLFEPGSIGTMEIRNRLVFPPMGAGLADSSGRVNDRVVDYCVARARGGVGLFIVEAASISPEGRVVADQLAVYDDVYVPGLKRLAEAVKNEGARVALQLHHAGRRARRLATGVQPVAPSPIAIYGGEVPGELTVEEVERLVEAFGEGARRAKEAGFDAVEVHAANGHLVAQFLSPLTNKRRDKYGGDLESRARFALDICLRIREKAGVGYPLLYRLSADEFIKGGNTPKDAQRIARLLVGRGVNAIHTSAAYVASSEEGYIAALMPGSFGPMAYPNGHLIHLAQAIKQAVDVPVIGVGRITDPRLADQFLREGKADFISMGRALLADPELPRKAAQGKFEDIRKCIGCNVCIMGPMAGGHLVCTVNTELGREREYQMRPAQTPKRVVIVGGGPGGMEAARVAALRGHRVTLLERMDHLGGNLISASAVSFKQTIAEFLYYLTTQLAKLPVEVKLRKEATAETVLSLNPEAVIVAAGARTVLPEIPGTNRDTVSNAVDVLSRAREVGDKVVVVGGKMIGCETAVFLAQRGKSVTLVTRRSSDFGLKEGLAVDMEPFLRRWFLFDLWPSLDIGVVAKSTFQEVTDRGLVVRGIEGDCRLIEADSIVFALDLVSSREMETSLSGRVAQLHMIGDCVRPREIVNAVHEGAAVARSI